MPSIIETGLEYAPYVGAAAGYAAGMLAEQKIQHTNDLHRQAASEVLTGNRDVVSGSNRMNVNRLLGPIALAAAVTGGFVGYAVQEQPGKLSDKPAIELIVDRSGGTSSVFGDNTPAKRVDRVLEGFSTDDSYRVNVTVGVGGEQIAMKPEDVKDVRPFGDAPLGRMYNSVTSEALINSDQENEKPSTAVVVVTNGNTFGDTKSNIREAKRANTSVFVLNVSENEGKEVSSFKELAKNTQGEYLDNEESLDNGVVERVLENLEPAKVVDPENGNDWKSTLFVGFLGAASLYAAIRKKRRDPVDLSLITNKGD